MLCNSLGTEYKSCGVPSAVFYVATEICRLRWNWLYLILVSLLLFISYTSIISSFHQFITNPTAQQLNGTEKEDKVSPIIVSEYCHIVYFHNINRPVARIF